MKKSLFLIGLLLVFCYSCKTLTVGNKQYQKTSYPVTLGSLGQDDENIMGASHTQTGEANYTQIKAMAKPVAFSKTSYKAFLEAKNSQTANVSVAYVDSLETKPTFLNIELADKIGLVSMLNDKSNTSVKDYLMNQNEAQIVTRISAVFNETDMKALTSAQEVFLEANGVDSYALTIYQNAEKVKTVKFQDGVIFAYRAANCCWKQNDKYQLEIVDLVEGNDKCPYQSHLWSSRAKKKINYFKL